jgi:hypothetical protein
MKLSEPRHSNMKMTATHLTNDTDSRHVNMKMTATHHINDGAK